MIPTSTVERSVILKSWFSVKYFLLEFERMEFGAVAAIS
jgi:hypothetical protein